MRDNFRPNLLNGRLAARMATNSSMSLLRSCDYLLEIGSTRPKIMHALRVSYEPSRCPS